MKSKFLFPTTKNLFFSTAIAATVSMIWQASAANLTWDITPGTVGAGDSTITGGIGAWNTTNGNWTTDGGVNNIAWVDGSDTAFFGGTAGTVTLGTPITAGGITFNSAYTLASTTPATDILTLAGTTPTVTAASGLTGTISSVIAGSAGFTKAGLGTVSFEGGTLAKTYSGSTTVNAGILAVAYGTFTGNNLIPSTSPLVLNGGALQVLLASGTSRTQTFGGTTINPGNSAVQLNKGGSGGTALLTLGSITRNSGGLLNVHLSHTGANRNIQSASWTSGQTVSDSGVAYATYVQTGSTATTAFTANDWAAYNGTTVVATTYTPTTTSSLAGNANVATGVDTTLTGDTTITTLRDILDETRFIDIGSGNTLTTGGILIGSPVTGTVTITGGTLRSAATAANKDLVVISHGGTLLVNSVISDVTFGATGLTKSGAGALLLAGANTYTGPTIINGGRVQFANTASLYSGVSTSWTASNIIVNSGGGLFLNVGGFGEFATTDVNTLLTNLDGAVTTGGLRAGSSIGFDTTNASGGTFTVPVGIADSTGTGGGTIGLAKLGANTLVLSGANTYTGSTTVSAGTLVASGGVSFTPAGTLLTVGNIAATNATLNIPSGATTTAAFSPLVGTNAAVGAINITGGTLTTTTDSDNASFGASNSGYGAFTMSSGTMTSPRFMFGGSFGNTGTGGVGVGLITGGTVNSNNWLILGRIGASTGVLTITGGTINHTGAINTLSIGLQGSGRAELNVAGGLIDNSGQKVTFSGGTTGTFHWTGTGLLNLNAGTLTTDSILYDTNVNSANASSYINFSGGTLKTSGVGSATFLPAFTPTGTGVNRVFINGPFGTFAGGAIIDTNGLNSTIGANLLAPTGVGVTSLTVDDGGSGYIGAPAVKILDNGLPSTATAYAVVGTDAANLATFGKVTSVVITNPGVITGTATVTLSGGGGTGAGVSVATTGANTSGGLTKIGNGVLTLSGSNTYTGATNISAGSLALGANNVLADTTAVYISNATLDASTFTDTVGTLDVAGTSSINLGSGAALAFANSNGVSWTGGTLALTGTFVSGSSLRFGTSNTGLTSTQLALISASGFTGFALDNDGYLTATVLPGYAAWQSANSTAQTIDLDHDNDGVSNGVEYFLFGSANTTGFTALPGVTNTAGTLSITWVKSGGYAGNYGTDFFVETSSTLETGSWTTAATSGNPAVSNTVNISGNNVTYTFPAGTKSFARLKVTGP